jgi:hypothetical protein
VAGFVFGEGILPEDDGVEFAVAVGDVDADDDAAVVGEADRLWP